MRSLIVTVLFLLSFVGGASATDPILHQGPDGEVLEPEDAMDKLTDTLTDTLMDIAPEDEDLDGTTLGMLSAPKVALAGNRFLPPRTSGQNLVTSELSRDVSCAYFNKKPSTLKAGEMRITLRSFNKDTIEEAAAMIKTTVAESPSPTAEIKAYVGFPKRRDPYCVLRSPHVNKNGMEAFKKTTHKRLIDIKGIDRETIERLMKVEPDADVEIKVKMN